MRKIRHSRRPAQSHRPTLLERLETRTLFAYAAAPDAYTLYEDQPLNVPSTPAAVDYAFHIDPSYPGFTSGATGMPQPGYYAASRNAAGGVTVTYHGPYSAGNPFDIWT